MTRTSVDGRIIPTVTADPIKLLHCRTGTELLVIVWTIGMRGGGDGLIWGYTPPPIL